MKVVVSTGSTAGEFVDLYNLTITRLYALNDEVAGNPLGLAEPARDASVDHISKLEIGGTALVASSGIKICLEFYDRYRTNLAGLIVLNPGIEAKLTTCDAGRTAIAQRLACDFLIVPDPAPEAGPVQPANAPPPVDANPGFDWLVYETRVNAEKYQKGKVALAYGLYAVPVDHRAEIVASRHLPEILVKAFFPGMSDVEVRHLSDRSCRWRKKAASRDALGFNSVAQQVVGGAEATLHAPRMMVMPYNYRANDESSHAIGTMLEEEIVSGPCFRLKKFWPLWETASRSSVARLVATTEADLAPANRLAAAWDLRSKDPPDGAAMPPAYKDKPFNLGEHADCYSVKTGVRWLGEVQQGSDDAAGGKDVLEVNALLASMRSDWVEHVEDTIGAAPDLIVLRELLTVTFPNVKHCTRDGYQIRDLRPLDPTKIYFPPLSIPFGGRAFVDAYNVLHPTAPQTFTAFWQTAYAEAIGRAKAELLLRYGLQLTTPNPQNFLLEFDRATLEPTRRVVIRDIGDAKLHSEVIGQIGGDHAAIKYELTDPDRPGYLPAQTNNQGRANDRLLHARFDQYPLNTRVHWHQYSSFKDAYGGLYLPEGKLTAVDWGRAHYRAYLAHLNKRLAPVLVDLPVFGADAAIRIAAAIESAPNTSKGEAAKRFLPQLMKGANGNAANIDRSTYAALRANNPGVDNDILYTEWAFEVHTDELLHEALCKPDVLAQIKAVWV